MQIPIVTTNVEVAGRRYELRRPESADALLDLLTEEDFAQDDRLPYWAEVWPSSRVLAERVARLSGQGQRLLELGCGVGLVALAAANAGFAVLASDYYAEAVEFTTANARLNRLDAIVARLVDWRALPADLGRFDLVVASDVLYERPNSALVAAVLAQTLTASGRAIVTDPGRKPALQFPAACAEHGLEVVPLEQVPMLDGETRLTVHVCEVRWADGRTTNSQNAS